MNKKILALLSVAFAWMCMATQCEKEKPVVLKLPPETQEGKNTFGCLIDGKVFVTNPKLVGLVPPKGGTTADLYCSEYGSILNIHSYLSPAGIIAISIHHPFTDSLRIFKCSFSCGKEIRNCDFYGEGSGSIVLTKLDTVNKIVSGSFEYDAHCFDANGNPCGKITDGRFDINMFFAHQ